MVEELQNEVQGWARVQIFLANWVLLIFAPVWAPLAFWKYAISGKHFLRNLLTGRNLISE